MSQPEALRNRLSGLTLAFVVVGVALRAIQYLAGVSQWLDEILLSATVIARPLGALLTEPLPFAQAPPRGVLLAEKLAELAFGDSDAALRAFSFASSLAALLLFAGLARRLLRGMAQPAAVALFATAAPLISQAGQAKQYSSDVCAAVAVLWIAVELRARPPSARAALGAGLAGVAAVFFSQAASVMLAAAACVLLIEALEDRARIPRLAAVVALWGAGIAASTALITATVSSEHREYFLRYWAPGFPPRPLLQRETLLWPFRMLAGFFGSGGPASLCFPAPRAMLLLAAAGAIALIRGAPAVARLLLAPLAVALVAGFARVYPFQDRVILYLLPCLFLLLAAGMAWAAGLAGRLAGPLAPAALCVFLLAAAGGTLASPPPYRSEDLRPALAFLRDHRRPGDRVYVYYGALPQFHYYAARYGLGRGDFVDGACHRSDTPGYWHDLEAFRGKGRFWLVMAHSVLRYHEKEDLLRYLDAAGVRLDALVVPPHGPQFMSSDLLDGAAVYLFELPPGKRPPEGLKPSVASGEADPRFRCE